MTSPLQSLTVVVPVFNEAKGLSAFHARLGAVLDKLNMDCRVLYVDDGSRDESWRVITGLQQADERVLGLSFSRNFGKELAMTAGLDAAEGDAVVMIDADLQDPPELIESFVAHWREGYDVVYGRRIERRGESWLKRLTALVFYRVMRGMSDTPIPADTGDFRLLSRRAVDALGRLRERQRFMKGLFAWVGFRQLALDYARDPRHAGRSSFNYWRLWNFAIEGFTSFSTLPLRLATYVGVVTALLAFVGGAWVVIKTLLWGDPVAGYPSLMVVVLMLGGIQLMALGIAGEYLGRLYMEVKGRPLYLIQERCGVSTGGPDATARAGAVDSVNERATS